VNSYSELHCHSNFSFGDGASHPEDLVEEAARLGIGALAITDHNGLYAAVRHAQAAREAGIGSVFGAELTLAPSGSPPRTGVADPPGEHLVVLARDPDGYALLSSAIAHAQMKGGEKGRPLFSLEELAGQHRNCWAVLTGCRKGTVPAAIDKRGPAAAEAELRRLVAAFGSDNVFVELWHHGDPLDSARNDVLAEIALKTGVGIVATNNVHYARRGDYRLACTLGAIRANRTLEEMRPYLPVSPSAHLRSGAMQQRIMARWPGTVEAAGELGESCAFDLKLIAPSLPDCRVPAGHTEQSYLEELVEAAAALRYGPRTAEKVPGAWEQIDHELAVIGRLGYAGYFLIVYDIVRFCVSNDIYAQGRGSAANSAVCYVLGITRADAVSLGLLFERFLSEAREGPPDIDIDIESGRREEVIQYVYEKYGRERAALVANVITYRPKSAVRDVGKALGHDPATIAALSASVGHLRRPYSTGEVAGLMPDPVMGELVEQVLDFPRHLGIHPGGMVICDRPVVEVCPVEWARMDARSVLQWDKDDVAAAGLVKFDLLGLGMLEVLHRCVNLVADFHGVKIDLASIPQEDAVYEMLCKADTIGVFQVESRAQMNVLPRLKPRCFYDLVIEVALVRPGPIQGGSVHPYLRRRAGTEPVTYLHPSMEPALAKTLGVPIFQEQLMRVACATAGLSPSEANELREAMSAKRSAARMERLRERMFAGMALNGIEGDVAEQIYASLAAFANFGFPESHAISFAYITYASAWLRLHYPAAYLAACLNSQPFGFWSPQSLVADARRHGVETLPPHVNISAAEATLEAGERPDSPVVRLGLSSVRCVGVDTAHRIAECAPYSSMEDLVRRAGVDRKAMESLAMAGALAGLAPLPGMHPVQAGDRRRALWAATPVSQSHPQRLPGMVSGANPPDLPAMSLADQVTADIWTAGLTTGPTAIELARPMLARHGVLPAARLGEVEHDCHVRVAGVVTHRQRPDTARGTTFVSLEDETGIVNVIVSPGAWVRYREVVSGAPALLVRGHIEKSGNIVNVNAEKIEPLYLEALVPAARNFR
jgi:error-prone DNA polymerase